MQDERIYVRGDVLVSDLNETFELLLPTDDVNTIGGLVLKDIGATPGAGDVVVLNAGESDIAFYVESIYQHGIASVSFAATSEQIDRVDLLLQVDN